MFFFIVFKGLKRRRWLSKKRIKEEIQMLASGKEKETSVIESKKRMTDGLYIEVEKLNAQLEKARSHQ